MSDVCDKATNLSVQVGCDKVVGVVLAGGLSSRMGENKALLQCQGKHLWQHAVDTLQQTGIKQVLVSAGNANFGIPDIVSCKGPVGAIHAILNAVPCDHKEVSFWLFLPVDMPAIQPKQLQALLQSAIDNQCSTYYQNYPLPCVLRNSAQLRKIIDDLIGLPSASIRQLLKQNNAQYIELEQNCESVDFVNINTPKDWNLFKQASQATHKNGQQKNESK